MTLVLHYSQEGSSIYKVFYNLKDALQYAESCVLFNQYDSVTIVDVDTQEEVYYLSNW